MKNYHYQLIICLLLIISPIENSFSDSEFSLEEQSILPKDKYPNLQKAINSIFENLVISSNEIIGEYGSELSTKSSPQYFLNIIDSNMFIANVVHEHDLRKDPFSTPYNINISKATIDFLMTNEEGDLDVLNGLRRLTGVISHEIAHSYENLKINNMSLDEKTSSQTIEVFTDYRGRKIAFNAGFPQNSLHNTIYKLSLIEGEAKTRDEVLKKSLGLTEHSHPDLNLRVAINQVGMIISRAEEGDHGDDKLKRYITPGIKKEVVQLQHDLNVEITLQSQIDKVNKEIQRHLSLGKNHYDSEMETLLNELKKTFTILKDEPVSKDLIDNVVNKIIIPISKLESTTIFNLDENSSIIEKIPLFKNKDFQEAVTKYIQVKDFNSKIDSTNTFKNFDARGNFYSRLSLQRLFLPRSVFMKVNESTLDEIINYISENKSWPGEHNFEMFKNLRNSMYYSEYLINIFIERHFTNIENCHFDNCLNLLDSPFRDWNSTPITKSTSTWAHLKSSHPTLWKKLENEYLNKLWREKGHFAISDLFNARETTYDWRKISLKLGKDNADLKKDLLEFVKTDQFKELIRTSALNKDETAFITHFFENNKKRSYEGKSLGSSNTGQFSPANLHWIDEEIFHAAIKYLPKNSQEYFTLRRLFYIHSPNLYRKHLKKSIQTRIDNAISSGKNTVDVNDIWSKSMKELYGSDKYPPAYSVDILYESIDQSNLSKSAKSKIIVENSFFNWFDKDINKSSQVKIDSPPRKLHKETLIIDNEIPPPFKELSNEKQFYSSPPHIYGMMNMHRYRINNYKENDSIFMSSNLDNPTGRNMGRYYINFEPEATAFEKWGDNGNKAMRNSNFNIIFKHAKNEFGDSIYSNQQLLNYLLGYSELSGASTYRDFIINYASELMKSSLNEEDKTSQLKYLINSIENNHFKNSFLNNELVKNFIDIIEKSDISDHKKVELFFNSVAVQKNKKTDLFVKKFILPSLKSSRNAYDEISKLATILLHQDKIHSEELKFVLFYELNRNWNNLNDKFFHYSTPFPPSLMERKELRDIKVGKDFKSDTQKRDKFLYQQKRDPILTKLLSQSKMTVQPLGYLLRNLNIEPSIQRDKLIEDWLWDNHINDIGSLKEAEKLKTTSTINLSLLPINQLSGISHYLSNLNSEQRKELIRYILKNDEEAFPKSLLNLVDEDLETISKILLGIKVEGIPKDIIKNLLKSHLEDFISSMGSNEKTLLNNLIFNSPPALLENAKYLDFIIDNHLKLSDHYKEMLKAYLNTPPLDEKSMTISYLLSLPNDDQERSFLKIFDAFKTIGPKSAQIAPDLDFFDKKTNLILDEYKDSAKPMSKYLLTSEIEKLPEDVRGQIKNLKAILGSASIKTVVLLEMEDGSERVAAFKNPNAAAQINYHITRAEHFLKELEKSNIKFSKNLVDNFIFYLKNILNEEIDFELESKKLKANAKIYSKINKKMKQSMNGWSFSVPSVDDTLKTHENIIFMKKGEGVTFRKLASSVQKEIGPHIIESSLISMFEHGHFNPDQHSGNFLVDEKTKTISPIDFGQSQIFAKNRLNILKDERYIFIQFLRYLQDGNMKEVLKYYNKMSDKKINIDHSILTTLNEAISQEGSSSKKIIKALNLLSEKGGFLKKQYLFGLKGLLTLSRNGYVDENQFKEILTKQASNFMESHLMLNTPFIGSCIKKILKDSI